MSRFVQQVDPDGTLPAWKRAIRAEAAKRLHYTILAFNRWHDSDTDTGSTSRPNRYPCKRCLMEQGQPIELSSNGRICKRHATLWRIRALEWLMEHGGDIQEVYRARQEALPTSA
ncbi:MAG: hypothetical protein ACXWP0_04400 [Ktedonobacterales bacterium]